MSSHIVTQRYVVDWVSMERRWILAQCDRTIEVATRTLEEYEVIYAKFERMAKHLAGDKLTQAICRHCGLHLNQHMGEEGKCLFSAQRFEDYTRVERQQALNFQQAVGMRVYSVGTKDSNSLLRTYAVDDVKRTRAFVQSLNQKSDRKKWRR